MGNEPLKPDENGVDPVLPGLEVETRRRRGRLLFRHRRVPVRLIVPNFVTVLGLCAGLTSIRMGIEGRYDLAIAAIVFAACLDGVDGRIARLLKASSRFGAELDSLADFVNFGVAPAFLIYNWGLGTLKSAGWICVLIFALSSALRLARFNAALDDDKPKWQAAYFTGMPTPAAAIAVMLPVYLYNLGVEDIRSAWALKGVFVYTLFIAFMMVSAIPTFSGKLLGERIGREWVMPMIITAVAGVAMLLSYPYEMLAFVSLVYLAVIPLSWRRFQDKAREGAAGMGVPDSAGADPALRPGQGATGSAASGAATPAQKDEDKMRPGGRVLPWRQGEPPR